MSALGHYNTYHLLDLHIHMLTSLIYKIVFQQCCQGTSRHVKWNIMNSLIAKTQSKCAWDWWSSRCSPLNVDSCCLGTNLVEALQKRHSIPTLTNSVDNLVPPPDHDVAWIKPSLASSAWAWHFMLIGPWWVADFWLFKESSRHINIVHSDRPWSSRGGYPSDWEK